MRRLPAALLASFRPGSMIRRLPAALLASSRPGCGIPRPPTAAVLLAVVLLVPACTDQAPTGRGLREEILAHRVLWQSVRPAAYSFELERLCFCGEEGRGPVRIEVSAGQVVERAYLSTGEPVPEDLKPYFPGVEGLFDVLLDAVDRRAPTVNVTWDPSSGIPVDFWIDYDEAVADEEQGFKVRAGPTAIPGS